MNVSENNTRIIKNTLALYFRQIITMGVLFFTSRLILQILGIEDYGIYSVVGSVVAMFWFMSNTLTVITQRFISVELGKGNNDVLQKIFSTSMLLHLAVGVVIVILAETVGIWFLENNLVIPPERMPAAKWVYQFAVFSFLLSLLNAPHLALIFSHEDMHIYGFMGIFDAVIRLVTVYLLTLISVDKLVLLAALGFAASCLVSLVYLIYCRRKYSEARFSFTYDRKLLKELSGFGGHVFGASVIMTLRTQGVNIMLNIFFGPAVNAARGIASYVSIALTSLGGNLKQAIQPQLLKSYAQNNPQYMWNMAERGTRMIYFLILIFAVPLLLETDFLLTIWLGDVPAYTVIFTQLIIIMIMADGLLYTLGIINNATGKVGAFYCAEYYVGSTLILLLSYITCKIGYGPQYVFIIPIVIWPLIMATCFIIMKRKINFPIRHFTQKALTPIFFVTAISFLPFYLGNKLYSQSGFRSLTVIALSFIWTIIIVGFIGLKKHERDKIFAFVIGKTNRNNTIAKKMIRK